MLIADNVAAIGRIVLIIAAKRDRDGTQELLILKDLHRLGGVINNGHRAVTDGEIRLGVFTAIDSPT